jgi:hypothetical protein
MTNYNNIKVVDCKVLFFLVLKQKSHKFENTTSPNEFSLDTAKNPNIFKNF